MSIAENFKKFTEKLPKEITLVAVSKTKPIEDIQQVYTQGHRIFGENKIQELVGKWEQLPKDIQWHMIGHLQTNKVKYIAPFVSLIHAVDSLKLLKEINKRAKQNNRVINCLLQIKIAQEESKFGLSVTDFENLWQSKEFKKLQNINIVGLMGMATNTKDKQEIISEFQSLKNIFDKYNELTILSMGMSNDFEIAIKNGSNMIRVGSKIFGNRNYA